MICGGHFICILALSYQVDTHGMIRYPLWEMDEASLNCLREVVRGLDQVLRIPPNNVVVSIRQMDPVQ